MYTTWFKGQWSDGNTPLIGAMDHGVWLASTVFDGARSIHRMVPDLRAHCQRTFDSAERVGLGVPLTMDPRTERFAGNDRANAMLTREYRKPYVVPEIGATV